MNPWAEHFGAEEVDLSTVDFTTELLACIPAEMARRYRVLPISNLRRELWISMADPSDPEALDSLHQLLGRELVLCVSNPSHVDEFIERLYGSEGRG
jgi:type IV pilus assembly protein PilB